MTDTAVLKPKWQLILGLLPSLNQCLIITVTGAVTCFTTLWLAKPVAKPAEKPTTITIERIVERPAAVDLAPLTGKLDALLEELRTRQSSAGAPKRSRGSNTKPLK